MLLSFLFQNLMSGGKGIQTQIGVLTLDVTLEEVHRLDAQISDYPVETGAAITDHVRLLPKTLQISGFVTDTPLKEVGLSLGRSRAASAFFALEAMWRARIPFAVVSQLQVYQNMVIENLYVPKEREQAIRFTCFMREIQFVTGQNVVMPATGDVGLQNNPAIAANGGGVAGMIRDNVLQPAMDAVGLDLGRQSPVVAAVSNLAAAQSLFRVFQ